MAIVGIDFACRPTPFQQFYDLCFCVLFAQAMGASLLPFQRCGYNMPMLQNPYEAPREVPKVVESRAKPLRALALLACLFAGTIAAFAGFIVGMGASLALMMSLNVNLNDAGATIPLLTGIFSALTTAVLILLLTAKAWN